VEELVMFPFVAYGRTLARRRPLAKDYDLVCFFPKYELGGAEKVHADILSCFPDKRILVFFTRRSRNDRMLHLFRGKQVDIQDISEETDNKWKYWRNLIWRGVCAAYIDAQPAGTVVFSGQCNFGYKLFPHLKKEVPKVELIHVAEKKFSWITFPYIGFIDKRVMIADTVVEKAKDYYRKIGVPAVYEDRICKIMNRTDIPETVPDREYAGRIKIYYAGRGGYPKRIYLLAAIARKCHELSLPVEFQFAGNFEDELPGDIRSYTHFLGQKEGGQQMNELHREMDVLIMTSASEAFPMVIMEAMAHGVVVISTAVGGIPEHIRDGENGLLIRATQEDALVEEAVVKIKMVCEDRESLSSISKNARLYAAAHFSTAVFCKAYREVLFS